LQNDGWFSGARNRADIQTRSLLSIAARLEMAGSNQYRFEPQYGDGTGIDCGLPGGVFGSSTGILVSSAVCSRISSEEPSLPQSTP
jgi:hypothetical protein